MKKILPALVPGFAAGVLAIVPVAKNFGCCLIIPAAAVAAVFLEQTSKGNKESVEMSRALVLGLLTGIFAALFGSAFDVIITLVTKSNELVSAFGELQKVLSNLPLSDEVKQQVSNLFTNMINDIQATGFSLVYTISMFFNSLITNIIFGLIGGLIGAKIYNSKNQAMNG
ncbi:MAG: DUF4199 domain-containing protein [Chlorobi bacterium]|nr:DUF4199 domain-containing protein [Chlorobiota bacterium]